MSHEHDQDIARFRRADSAATVAIENGDYQAAMRHCEQAGRIARRLRTATGDRTWDNAAEKHQNAAASARSQVRKD